MVALYKSPMKDYFEFVEPMGNGEYKSENHDGLPKYRATVSLDAFGYITLG